MTKEMFLYGLKCKLSSIPVQEREERLSFYSEMIDDRMEEGMREEEAVASIGTIDAVAREILASQRFSIPKEQDTPKSKKRWKAWEIVLLVLGSPLWISLLIASFVVAVSLFVSLWSVIASLWAVMIALSVGGVFGVIIGVVALLCGQVPLGFALIGCFAFSAGLSVFLFFATLYSTKGAWFVSRKSVLWLIHSFYRKDEKR